MTRALAKLRQAPQRQIQDAQGTHPLARALLIRYIAEHHNSLLDADDDDERRLMCSELRVFPRSNIRRDPRLLFVHLPPAAFLAFFWKLICPRSSGLEYYLEQQPFNLNRPTHIEAAYGSVLDVRRSPFTLRQYFGGVEGNG